MKKHGFRVLVPGILTATVLALTMGVGAQTHDADTMAECQAMMAKKQEMQDKLRATDATLEKLVAEMNAAKGSKQVDAMVNSMAAVINELVAQRKASRSMMEAQPAMMGHMMRHKGMPGAKGSMECPMMKAGNPTEPKAEEKKPSM